MFPANMDVISWLGAFHVKNEVRPGANTERRPLCIVSMHDMMQGSEICWFDETASMVLGTGKGEGGAGVTWGYRLCQSHMPAHQQRTVIPLMGPSQRSLAKVNVHVHVLPGLHPAHSRPPPPPPPLPHSKCQAKSNITSKYTVARVQCILCLHTAHTPGWTVCAYPYP